MDFNSLLNYVTVVAGVATLSAVQLLKSKLVPVRFQNYPVPTTLVVSALATYLALRSQHFAFAWHNWTETLGTFTVVVLVAALTYNHVVAQWPGVKSTEQPKV